MKTRVISGVIAAAMLVFVLLSHQIVLGISIFICSIIGIYEFYNSISKAGYKPIKFIGYLSCLPIIFIGLNGVFKSVDSYFALFKTVNYLSLFIFIFVIGLFSLIIFKNDKYNLNDIALTIFGVFYVSFLFSFIILTRNINEMTPLDKNLGLYFVLLIFIGAFITDTFAYFIGVNFGKKKLIPVISPNKSVEGSIGGVVGCVIITVLYGMYLNKYVLSSNIALYHFIILGILNGLISQIGDLSASSIKRYVKIKDFGNLMPGHGGVLDRFDSILFTAPVVYFYISFIIM